MSLNRGLENGPVVLPLDTVVPSYVPTATNSVFVSSEQPWLLTIASLELKVANLERRVAELESLAETQGTLNQKLLQTLELLALRCELN